MLLNIIFSYNRAMQLDYLLQSILDKFKIDDYEVAIIYHTTGEHAKGYQLLQENYKEHKFIKFYKRKEGFDAGILPAINCRTHLKFFKKYHFKNKKRDNFKGLLENILKMTSHEFVMFNTDDGVFYKDFQLEEDVQSIIRCNPTAASYRNYIGDNIDGFPSYVKKWGENYLWDYYHDKDKVTHWSYPFAVDGTVYNTKGILSIIKKIAYHNPITLEEKGVTFIRRNRLFGIGLSPLNSRLKGTILNRVSVDSSNPTLNVHIDFLNEKYLNGYNLDLELFKTDYQVNVIPQKIIFIKDNLKEVFYEIDTEGENIQNNYSSEGSKIQTDN